MQGLKRVGHHASCVDVVSLKVPMPPERGLGPRDTSQPPLRQNLWRQDGANDEADDEDPADEEEKEAKRQQMLRGLQWLKERAEQVRKRKAELAEQERQRKAEEAEEKKRKQDRERCVRLVEQFIERMRSLKKPKAALLVTPLPKRKYTKHKQKGEKFGEYNNGKLGKIRTKKYTGSDKGREAAAARKRRQREREKNAKTTTKKTIKKTTKKTTH